MNELPSDLEAFLQGNGSLDYDTSDCDAGRVTLVPFHDLHPIYFPVETSSFPNFTDDPNHPKVNSYLVLAINLTAECNDEYRPEGILIWLPIENRYGFWDDSHCTISMFPIETTWRDIVSSPLKYLDACCGGDEIGLETLVPWPNHPYHNAQVHDPLEMNSGG